MQGFFQSLETGLFRQPQHTLDGPCFQRGKLPPGIVIAVLGICWLLNVEITLLIVTALLTLAGYSLNDSVVVFDRIREHLRKAKSSGLGFAEIINLSINEVLSRTIVTSLTSVMVLVALFILGGAVIHDFSLALLAGIIVGTYSSIFVASPLLYLWREKAGL